MIREIIDDIVRNFDLEKFNKLFREKTRYWNFDFKRLPDEYDNDMFADGEKIGDFKTKINENDFEIIDFLENSVAWIEKIATISKLITALKAEKYEMKLTEFCLCNLLDEVLYNFSEKINEKQIKLISNHNDNKLLVKADYYLLNLYFQIAK